MCGICGILNVDSGEPVSKNILRDMCSVLVHRGPDEEGIHISADGTAGIGFRRLSIIDLETGNQPVSNEDRKVYAAANGEIYNYKELRNELGAKGHLFRTKGDIETMVHLYEECGIGLIGRLRGAFAFCLWDERGRKLFLARDRVGKRPLYYTVSRGRLIFASEIKSILRAPGINRDINHRAVHDYLTYGYIPHPDTVFKGIEKIPPAHYLECAGGKMEIKKYWELDFSRKREMTESGFCENIRAILEESVKLRLESDVPLGAFLSGGLDSSIVVSIMSGFKSRPVKTFSIGFEEEDFSELKYARLASNHFKTEHHEYIVKPDVRNLLPKLAWHYDEPYADSSSVACYHLARMASGKVRVAITGDGGDENMAGYPRHKAARLAGYLSALPETVKKSLRDIAKTFPETNSNLIKARAFLETLGCCPAYRHARYVCIFDNSVKENLYSDDFRQIAVDRNSFDFMAELHEIAKFSDCLDRMLSADIMSYLPGDLLVKMDIAGMANSLETRSPLLDQKFLEFSSGIPSGLKLKGFNAKYILKKAYSGIIPEPIIRRRKMGFGVPVSRWLRCELRDMVYDVVVSQRAVERGYFNRECLKRMLYEHTEKKADHGHRLWSLLMLELWHLAFIDS